jgi:hypothetical protein
MASGNHHLILVHGADRLAFGEDIAEAEKRGVKVHALVLPRFDDHPIDDVHDYYLEVSATIEAETDSIRRSHEHAAIAGIGRNLGGSMLAYHLTRADCLEAIVLTGAIPDLSRFKARSGHEGAQRYRDMIGDEDHAGRFAKLADLDLTATLRSIPANACLLQAGLSDPWMDSQSVAIFRDFEQAGYRVEYLQDDHAMVAPETLARRWRFIDRRLRGAR